MHPKVEEAFEEIDASVFSSDTFESPENLEKLKHYLGRWQRWVDSHELMNSKCDICGGPNH